MSKKHILGAVFFSAFLFLGITTAKAANPNNSTPIIFSPDASSTIVTAGNTMNFILTGFDLDPGDILTFSAQNLPAGAILNNTSGLFTWTPTSTQVGTFPVIFSVSDGIDQNSINIDLTVNAPTSTPTSTPPKREHEHKKEREHRKTSEIRHSNIENKK